MNWNELATEAHQVAVEKGLWDKPVTFDDVAIECHAALSRAWEEYKAGRPNLYRLCQPSGEKRLACTGEACAYGTDGNCVARDTKPRGVAAELAECALRLLDWLEAQEGKTFKVGNFPFGGDLVEVLNTCHGDIGDASISVRCGVNVFAAVKTRVTMSIERIWSWAEWNRVDMKAVLREVLEYNRRRGKTDGWA